MCLWYIQIRVDQPYCKWHLNAHTLHTLTWERPFPHTCTWHSQWPHPSHWLLLLGKSRFYRDTSANAWTSSIKLCPNILAYLTCWARLVLQNTLKDIPALLPYHVGPLECGYPSLCILELQAMWRGSQWACQLVPWGRVFTHTTVLIYILFRCVWQPSCNLKRHSACVCVCVCVRVCRIYSNI